MATQANSGRMHFGALESLRGVAALCVVFYHIDWVNSLTGLNFFRNSYLMVDFFFVLSGFVIYHSYGERIVSLVSASRFIFLRLGRLYPLHLFTLLVFLAIEVSKYIAEVKYGLVANTPAFSVNNTPSFMANLFLMHAWNLQDRPTWNGPSWSISAEFFAYLSFTLVAFVLRRNRFVLTVFSVLLSMSCFYYLFHKIGHLDVFAQDSVVRCIAGFYLGVFVYQARSFFLARISGELVNQALHVWSVAVFLCIVITLSIVSNHKMNFVQPLLFAMAVFCISLLPADTGVNAMLNHKALRWLGMVSYSVYMVHQIVLWTITQFIRVVLGSPSQDGALNPGLLTGNLMVFVAVVSILVISHYSFRYIEDTFRRRSRLVADRIWQPAAVLANTSRENS